MTGLTSSELEQFEKENTILQQQLLNDYEKKLREVESQVVEISQATDILAQNVELQAEGLDSIHKMALEARDSIVSANKNIDLAKATSRDLRLFVLVLLIFMSFALLFLHWLND
eukprot:TRINITY_DN11286_c0_g1_i1.p2 TRINITY_DN11286_c0_g1~~TRINITY_DN11286_c0_g1_i1.p2  ORF type:complete len:114 (-),score=29.97 TRINITY_DN11286_c0_g1_i1:72-413(-)